MSLTFEGDGTIGGFDAGLSGFGGLVAVKSAIFTGTQSASTASGANFAVTDLTITHACADAANKLILMTTVGALTTSVGTLESGLAFHDGTNLIGVGATAGSRSSVSTGGLGKESGAGNGLSAFPQAFTLVHTPGDTSSRTYTVRAFNTFSTTQTISVNRSVSDTDTVRDVRAASTFTLMEVSV